MNDQSHAPTGEDLTPLIDRLISMVSENTTELKAMQQLFASTKAATDTSVEHTRTLAQNSSWEKQGEQIAKVLKEAVKEEREQASELLDAARINDESFSASISLIRQVLEALVSTSGSLREAATRQEAASVAHARGWWRRGAMIAAFGAVCAATGFFAKEPTTKTALLMEIGNALGENPHGVECSLIYGEKFTAPNSERRGCVQWEDPS